MKKQHPLRRWIVAALGTAAAISLSSCYGPYDGYYGASYGTGYDGGYGYGYGYGSGGFSTSYFIATGDPRWGYDPYSYAYYDYYRHSYYDPYLYGYYPVGYRPPVIIGVPHPHGWRPGHHRVPPPAHVYARTLSNYRDRESAYRHSNYQWAGQVRLSNSHSTLQGKPPAGYRRDSGTTTRPYSGSYRGPSSSYRAPQTRVYKPQTTIYQNNPQVIRSGPSRTAAMPSRRVVDPAVGTRQYTPHKTPPATRGSSQGRDTNRSDTKEKRRHPFQEMGRNI